MTCENKDFLIENSPEFYPHLNSLNGSINPLVFENRVDANKLELVSEWDYREKCRPSTT